MPYKCYNEGEKMWGKVGECGGSLKSTRRNWYPGINGWMIGYFFEDKVLMISTRMKKA